MSDHKVHVYINLEAKLHYVGLLWIHSIREKERAAFQYEQNWLAHPKRFALEPNLQLTGRTYHTGADRNMFGREQIAICLVQLEILLQIDGGVS